MELPGPPLRAHGDLDLDDINWALPHCPEGVVLMKLAPQGGLRFVLGWGVSEKDKGGERCAAMAVHLGLSADVRPLPTATCDLRGGQADCESAGLPRQKKKMFVERA
eukprot:CAMPEP_0118867804 /NCGR_PEP_ID=MMETSP1163-20130328/11272_1 /TAXON_ID=124430 /ORGANISM="Phaeomonas parva, Strain CCMP2877" /LENGTH=106 /DNA_ID=CAMNT_0006802261 /DNA_START=171 /DNA_END=492 /DNA_ORIENTATION=-